MFSDFFDITASQHCSVEKGSLLMICIEWNVGCVQALTVNELIKCNVSCDKREHSTSIFQTALEQSELRKSRS